MERRILETIKYTLDKKKITLRPNYGQRKRYVERYKEKFRLSQKVQEIFGQKRRKILNRRTRKVKLRQSWGPWLSLADKTHQSEKAEVCVDRKTVKQHRVKECLYDNFPFMLPRFHLLKWVSIGGKSSTKLYSMSIYSYKYLIETPFHSFSLLFLSLSLHLSLFFMRVHACAHTHTETQRDTHTVGFFLLCCFFPRQCAIM